MQRNNILAPIIALSLVMASFCFTSAVVADVITFSFESDGGGGTNGGETLGPALDVIPAASVISATNSGITFVLTATDTAGPATSNPGSTGIGVNGFGTDSTTQIETTESLNIAFNFDPMLFEVELIGFDLRDIGDATDSADVTLLDGTTFTYHDDVITPPSGFTFENFDNITAISNIPITSGQSLTFSDGSDGGFRLQDITLNVTDLTAVPEPGSLALVGLASLGMIARRRR